jgi:membrane-associated phospholipid phosphatase
LKEKVSHFYLSPFFMLTGVLLIGASRIFLGAHWFSDVIGGWLHGAAVATLLLIWLEYGSKFLLFTDSFRQKNK